MPDILPESEKGESEKVWYRSYGQTARTLMPYPDLTIIDYLQKYAKKPPNTPALWFKGREISYESLWQDIEQCARGLSQVGVKEGSVVALLLPNCPQFIVYQCATWLLGGIVAPMNPTYPDEEMAAVLDRTLAEYALVLTSLYAKVKGIQARTKVKTIIATNIKEYLPGPLRLAFTFFKEKKEGHGLKSISKGDYYSKQVMRLGQSQAGGAVRFIQPKPNAVATLLPSGGTTGLPKGVKGTHGAIVQSGLQLEAWLKEALSAGRDNIMLPLPLFHVYGCVGTQGLAFTGGRTLTLVPNPRDIDDVMATIAKAKPTFLAAVPTLFTAILNHKSVQSGTADFSSIRLCFSGAAPLAQETRDRFESLTGGQIVEGYSLTEAQMAALVAPVGRAKQGSIGVPLPDVQVLLVDPDVGEECMAEGEVGEIIIAAPQLSTGYAGQEEETAKTWRTRGDGQRWLYTGDLARMDRDGYFFIVDRKKDLIKVSGFQVWPTEVEQVISSFPGVQEVGVAGITDALRGEAAVAWVVMQAGQTLEVGQLKVFCKERLAAYKVPGKIRQVDSLPQSAIGKVLRREISKQEMER